jgi:hypothetical protein
MGLTRISEFNATGQDRILRDLNLRIDSAHSGSLLSLSPLALSPLALGCLALSPLALSRLASGAWASSQLRAAAPSGATRRCASHISLRRRVSVTGAPKLFGVMTPTAGSYMRS